MKKKAFGFSALALVLAFGLMTACNGGQNEPTVVDGWETVTPATCTEEGLERRTADNSQTRVIPALGHDYGEWQTIVPAGCTTNGSQSRTCSRCSNVENRTVEGHHTVNGSHYDIDRHWSTCSACNTQIEPTEHNFTTVREEKFAYIYDYLYGYNFWTRLPLGYVNVSRCADCDAVVYDACVVTGQNGNCAFMASSETRESIETSMIALTTGRFHLGLEAFRNYVGPYGAIGSAFTVTYNENYDPIRIDGTEGRYYRYDYEDGRIVKATRQEMFLTAETDEPIYRYCDFSYDADGNMIKTMSYTTGAKTPTDYAYYADGTLQRVTRFGNTIAAYDGNGLLTESRYLTIQNAVLQNGKRTSFKFNYQYTDEYSSGYSKVYDVTAAYNGKGQLISLTTSQKNSATVEIAYDEKDRISAVTVKSVDGLGQPKTTVHTYSYATTGQTTAVTVKRPTDSDPMFGFTYKSERKLMQK